MEAESSPDLSDDFERHRPRLFGIAYRMLGTVADAEDVVQSAYVRWHQAGAAVARNPEAWLVAVATRLSIDRLRSTAGERQRYVGDWLPEPLAVAPPAAEQRTEMAADLSIAFLVLLERLSPVERAAFLLRDVFEADYAEIASALEKSEAACRQIVHRARLRVRDGRRRHPVAPEAKERLLVRFLAGLQAGDQDALVELVAEDAPWTSDGGGRVPAAQRLRGARRIVVFLLRVARKSGSALRRELVWVNGEPAIANYLGGRLHSVVSVETDGERLVAFYAVLNPDKLRRVARA